MASVYHRLKALQELDDKPLGVYVHLSEVFPKGMPIYQILGFRSN